MQVLLVAQKAAGGIVALRASDDGELDTRDAGPNWTVARTHTASADMSTTANVTAAPTSGEKLVITDIIVSVDTAMNVILEEETAGTDFMKFYMPANSTLQITPRSPLKLNTKDKKLNAKASVSGNIALTIFYYSEA